MRWYTRKIIMLFSLISLGAYTLLLDGCVLLQPKLKNPTVELVGLHMLPAHGLQQHIAIDLMITNANKQELSIRGISYTIGIDDINVFTGATNQLPALKPFEKTPVTLEVSADILQVLRLLERLNRDGIGEKVNYTFNADIDFSAWLPIMHVSKTGLIPLKNKNK